MAWRYLKGNKSTAGPQNVLFVDTETTRSACPESADRSVERFRFGVALYGRLRAGRICSPQYLYFHTPQVFWRRVHALAKTREVLWVFTHSLGFDSRQLDLWQELDSGRLTRECRRRQSPTTKSGQRRSLTKTGLLVTADPPTAIEVYTPDGRLIRCVDTLNYFAASLATVGQWCGLDKLPMPDPWESDATWLEYCKRDVDILARATCKYIQWVKNNRLGMFRVTLPSQAMAAYRHSLGSKRIVIHDETNVTKLEGESYYGGEIYCGYIGAVRQNVDLSRFAYDPQRNTLFLPKCEFVHQLDSNSLFPSVMRSHRFPRRLLDWGLPDTGSRRTVATLDGACIAECLVDRSDIPVYTRRAGRSGRYLGPLVAVLCGAELQAALDHGIVVAVRRWARYELADLFGEYVDRCWQQRFNCSLSGNTFESLLWKKLMNSLYGKFAQRQHAWQDVLDEAPPFRWGSWAALSTASGECVHYRAIAGQTQRQCTIGYHHTAFPAISAFVTSYSRERMRYLRTVAGCKNVYYQGIDSLYVNDEGLAALDAAGEIDPTKLGKLRLEASETEADFCGHGLYRIGNRWVRTSIKRGAVEVQPGEYEQTNMERLDQALSRAPEHGVRVSTVKRVIAAANPVGIITDHGWVQPAIARWGDNPAETTDSRGFYGDNVGDWHKKFA